MYSAYCISSTLSRRMAKNAVNVDFIIAGRFSIAGDTSQLYFSSHWQGTKMCSVARKKTHSTMEILPLHSHKDHKLPIWVWVKLEVSKCVNSTFTYCYDLAGNYHTLQYSTIHLEHILCGQKTPVLCNAALYNSPRVNIPFMTIAQFNFWEGQKGLG